MASQVVKKAKTAGEPVLYSYWRSSCSWRVRIALALKNVDYKYEAVNLLKGEQRSEENLKRNVMGQVPALAVGDEVLSQSLAIIEYIEEMYDGHALLPKCPLKRAKVRAIANIIACGIQPIQNLGVLKKVAADFGEEHKMPWAKHWITEGFVALERELEKTAGKYCFGDEVTLADCCLVPQIYNANRFKVEMEKFPIISRVGKELDKHEAVIRAAPEKMPDAA